MNKRKKIFVIGPNKCGTSSLHNFFLENKLKSAHWNRGNLVLKILSNISANLDPLSDLEEYDCFSDMNFITDGLYISPLSFIKNLVEYYPEGIYIQNTRNFKDWDKSRLKHGKSYDQGSLNERLQNTFRKRYDSNKEFNGYNDIQKLKLKNFHIFDLDDDNKFIELSKFLNKNGIKITSKDEIFINKTTW